jgi:hypothetical protein
MVLKIEIEGIGEFDIKHDLLHRGNRPRLKTYHKGIFREVSFNSFEDYLNPTYQRGFDYEGTEIQINLRGRVNF